MLKQKLLLFSIFIVFISSFLGCQKKEGIDEPLTVSRLYVSISGFDSLAIHTLVFDPADRNPFSNFSKVPSTQWNAQGISFTGSYNNNGSGSFFQAGGVTRKINGITKFSVDQFGKITSNSFFADSTLRNPIEIASQKDTLLFVSNNSDSTLRAYENPLNMSGTRNKPKKKLKLSGKPWGISLNHDSLFVVIAGNAKEVQLFSAISRADSSTTPAHKSITINGSVNLQGIHYNKTNDILFVTDAGADNNTTDGKIFIILNISAKFTTGGAVNADRVIAGANTMLGNPVDVDFDNRPGKELIYVAEKLNHKILVFKLSDTGDVNPFISTNLGASPSAIYLDAR